jgi:hypothetical protein
VLIRSIASISHDGILGEGTGLNFFSFVGRVDLGWILVFGGARARARARVRAKASPGQQNPQFLATLTLTTTLWRKLGHSAPTSNFYTTQLY